ncbi:MAG TPA: sodium/calcium exchanger protein [Gammaproteobacteria bacterium]|nr:sodium/calcium exchanger protein [Gammaproteobacteria bacterium]
MTDQPSRDRPPGEEAAGLPGAPRRAESRLRRAGIDPDRLSIVRLGLPADALRPPYPQWLHRMAAGLALWLVLFGLERGGLVLPGWLAAAAALVTGLLLLQGACQAFVSGSGRLAARLRWDHYVAGTAAEILATLPELVAIGFVVAVSPAAAFTLALITIYLNTLVFSLYSYFLPKDARGKYVMPRPVTKAGTQMLTAGAGMGLILGLVMLALRPSGHPKHHFATYDLALVGILLLGIFAVYVGKLVGEYAREESQVQDTLELSEAEMEQRRELVYQNVEATPLPVIGWLLAAGVAGAFIGGERVSAFAEVALDQLGLNPLLTALILAGFAGLSEYVILYQAHRKGEYGIALANAFGGIIEVMFMVVPATLLVIAAYQGWTGAAHPDLPLAFSLSNIFLLLFLFPTFFVLLELLEEDHTLDILDTVVMTAIVGLLILVLVTYGAPQAAGQ